MQPNTHTDTASVLSDVPILIDSAQLAEDDTTPELGPLKHIAYYSSDASGAVRYDLSCIRSYRDPRLPASLSEGRDECTRRNRHNTIVGHPIALDHIVGACLHFGASAAVREADVVTWRGIITKLILSESALDLHVSLIDGVLYLMEVDRKPEMIHSSQIESGYHGYAFEALCTAPDPDEPVHVELDVWKCIVSRTLGDLKLLYGGEVDCVRGEYVGNSSNFVELKTLREAGTNKKKHKWFVQSHLMGVPEIVVGYRNDKNVLTKTQVTQTDHYAPHSMWCASRYRAAHASIHALRKLCVAHAFDRGEHPDNAVWRATVRHGEVKSFRILNKKEVKRLRARATQPRLGLLPVGHVAQLRGQKC